MRTLAGANLAELPVADYALVLLGAGAGMALLLFGARPLLVRSGMSGPTFTSLFQGATRFHGFMALAVVGALYGTPGLALSALAISILVPILNVLAVIVLSVWGEGAAGTSTASSCCGLRKIC